MKKKNAVHPGGRINDDKKRERNLVQSPAALYRRSVHRQTHACAHVGQTHHVYTRAIKTHSLRLLPLPDGLLRRPRTFFSRELLATALPRIYAQDRLVTVNSRAPASACMRTCVCVLLSANHSARIILRYVRSRKEALFSAAGKKKILKRPKWRSCAPRRL